LLVVYCDENTYHTTSSTWYTSEELKSFRADIWLTINWMVVNGSIIRDYAGDDSSDNNSDNSSLDSVSLYGGYDESRHHAVSLTKVMNQKYKNGCGPLYTFCTNGIDDCRAPTAIGRLLKQVILYELRMQK